MRKNIINYFKVCSILLNNIPVIKMDVSDLRIKYKDKKDAFIEDHIPIKEPINQFKIWFEEVLKDKEIIEPNAMCLSTATKQGAPSARFVLLKSFDKDGFKFYTNGISRKATELEGNPLAALTFYWAKLNRSVRLEGSVVQLPDKDAANYFCSRPYASQIGALASEQSHPIPSRDHLIERAMEMQKKYPEQKDVVKPPSWNGYVLRPHSVEFWQGQSDRMHDRIRFRRPKEIEKPDGVLLHQGVDGWVYERLAP